MFPLAKKTFCMGECILLPQFIHVALAFLISAACCIRPPMDTYIVLFIGRRIKSTPEAETTFPSGGGHIVELCVSEHQLMIIVCAQLATRHTQECALVIILRVVEPLQLSFHTGQWHQKTCLLDLKCFWQLEWGCLHSPPIFESGGAQALLPPYISAPALYMF